MSLKVLVQKLGSNNVVMLHYLSNTHHHMCKQVISEELRSVIALLSSQLYIPFQDLCYTNY